MKTTARIIMLAFMLCLASILTTALGAESVAELISNGQEVIAKTNAGKDALDAAIKKNGDLVTEGKQIRAENQQLQADIAAYKNQSDTVKQQTDDYQSKCDSKQLNSDQFKACKEQLAQINAAIIAVNAEPTKLNKRQNDFIARANTYNKEVQIAPKEVNSAGDGYRKALVNQYQWLDKARILVASPAFQPYAKKAGCPDVRNPAKTDEAAMKMSEEILTCLKKVASSN